jgi:hypothetical protein
MSDPRGGGDELWGFELEAGPIMPLAACLEAVRATLTQGLVDLDAALAALFYSSRGWTLVLAQ